MVTIFIIAVLLGLIFQKSKSVTAIQLVICAIIFSFNTENPDYTGYLGTYNSVNIGGIYKQYFEAYGFLYKQICIFTNKIGLNFNQFRILIFIICMILILSTIYKFTNKCNFVLSVYMIFPFIMDCIQIRNFIAEAIIIYSMRYLLLINAHQSKKRNIIKYVACVITASSFHSVSILYLLYLGLFFKEKLTLIKFELAGSIIVTLLLTQIDTSNFALGTYLSTRISWLTFLLFVGSSSVVMVILNCYIKKILSKGIIHDELYKQMLLLLQNTFVFMPFLIFHTDMFRFIRNLLLIFSSIAGFCLQRIMNTYKKSLAITSSAIVLPGVIITCYSLLLFKHAFYALDINFVNQVVNSVKIGW